MISLLNILFFFILFLLILYFLFKKQKEKNLLFRGMNLVLLLITLPQQAEKENTLENYLKIVEQFYSSLSGIKEKNFLKKFFVGDPFFAFEIAVPRIGEEIYFYVASPRSFVQLIEKQILGFWPRAQVRQTFDYNIFNPSGFSLGAEGFLGKSPLLPLKSSREFGADPLSSLTSIFTTLKKEGEGAAIQILIRPSRYSLKKSAQTVVKLLKEGAKLESAMKAGQVSGGIIEKLAKVISDIISSLFSPKPSSKPNPPDKPSSIQMTPKQQEIITAIENKIAKPLFDVNLRILASASTQERTQEIFTQLESAFEQFNSPIFNQIKFHKPKGRKLQKLFYLFSFRIFDEKKSFILSAEELANLFHFPSPSLLTPHIKWLKAKQAPPPLNLPTEGIILGKNVFRGEEKIVRILKKDKRHHFYIVGQTGTGKSTFLLEMIRQDIEAGEGVALIDPHGDLAEKVLGVIPPSRIEDVIYFNPADTEKSFGLNMLAYDPKFPESKTLVVNELLEIFEKLYNLKALGFGGPMFEQYMRNALLLVMEDPESGNTLIEVPRVLADKDFRKYKLSKCKNIVVKNFWELEAEKAGGEASLANMVPYITSKMNIFIANDLVRPIIAQQESSINFREVMDQGKVLIVNLSKGRLGDINSYLLGMIIVGKILIAALSRADIPEERRRDFSLYIDEFHNVTTRSITTTLAEARKYRLSLILAHQFIGQLDEETKKAIFGNVGSILAFRVGPEDAKYLITQFAPIFDENDLVNFDNFNGALRLLINGEPSKPFNLVTFPPKEGDPKIAQIIKERSRLKYGRDRVLVEAEIYERLSQNYA